MNSFRLVVVTFFAGLAVGAASYRVIAPHISSARASLSTEPVAVPKVEQYIDMTSIYRTFPSAADVVMVGDSITWMADWRVIFPGINILNRGIGFDNTAGLLARLDTVNQTKAKQVFVMIGTNDFLKSRDVDAVAERYEQILDGLEAPRVVMQSTLLTGPQKASRIPLILSLNTKIEALCAARPRCQFVDLNRYLAPAGMLDPKFTVDDVHLNGPAYRVWADAIRRFMPS